MKARINVTAPTSNPKESVPRENPFFTSVNGIDVPTVKWTFEQMQAEDCRIDRCNCISWVAVIASVASILISLIFR